MKTYIFLIITPLFFPSISAGQPHFAYPGYDTLNKPDDKHIEYALTPTHINFIFNDIEFDIRVLNPRETYPKVILKHGNEQMYECELGSIYFEAESCDIRSFDADQNGFEDVFIAYDFGPSGRNSSIQVIDAFFFLEKNEIKFSSLKSFYDTYELFRDFNHDGFIEFACTKWETCTDGSEYDFTNLFSIKNGAFTNISTSTKGFPLIIQWKDGEKRNLTTVPSQVNDSWYLKIPDVLNREQ